LNADIKSQWMIGVAATAVQNGSIRPDLRRVQRPTPDRMTRGTYRNKPLPGLNRFPTSAVPKVDERLKPSP
jgi:hypothetical protein